MQKTRGYIRSPKLHFTPVENLSAIKTEGLLTSKDPRGIGRIWLCDWFKSTWVMEHLTRLQKRSVQRFACFSVNYWRVTAHLRETKNAGIYYVTADIPARDIRLESTMWCDLHDGDSIVHKPALDLEGVKA